jgi:hypothetical protein
MEIKDHAPGTFCWAEVGQADQEAGKRFYASLLGCTHQDNPMPNGGAYTMLLLGGAPIAGLHQMDPGQGMPPHWALYVCVTSADEASKKAESLGGKVIAGPFDVMEHGRMAVLQDPSGAMISIWEPRAHKGFGRVGEPGAPVWFELMTRDTDAAAAFYKGLFGWDAETTSMAGIVYTTFKQNGQPVCGMMAMGPDMPMPPNWAIYFGVDDCDRSVAKTSELGGKVLMPPMDVPGIGRFAFVQDAQGAALAIIKMANPM